MKQNKAIFFSVVLQLSALNSQSKFIDVTEEAGIEHYFEVYEGMFGGGVCIVDYNKDGFEDIYLTGGKQPDQLLRNNGNGTFTDQLKNAGLEKSLEFVTQGVAVADINKDGWADLFITTITSKKEKKTIPRAENLIFLNRKDGSFQYATHQFGIEKFKSFSTGISFGDINLDGLPDAYVGNYFTDYDGGLTEISDATIVNAGKTALGYLLLNRKGKKFIQAYKKYKLNHQGFSFGGVFTDFNNDNHIDIIINNDFGYKSTPNKLLKNEYPKKRFSYQGKKFGLDLAINAMGTAIADIDNDEILDYYFTNIRFNLMMQHHHLDSLFRDTAKKKGFRKFAISWGANFADFDHDGDEDLFVSNGDLNPNCLPMHNFYFENTAGIFEEKSVKVGLNDYGIGRGSAIFDMDNDGDLDLLVVNQKAVLDYGTNSTTRLYRNELANGNFLMVTLKGKQSTTQGLGAKIKVYAQQKVWTKEVDGGNSSHLSHNSKRVHFGLGNRVKIDSIEVIWPGGRIQKKMATVNQHLIIMEKTSSGKHHSIHYKLLALVFIMLLFIKYRKFFPLIWGKMVKILPFYSA